MISNDYCYYQCLASLSATPLPVQYAQTHLLPQLGKQFGPHNIMHTLAPQYKAPK